MRRISLAVALIGAVAAAGCSGGAKPSSTSGTKGTAGVNFTVTVNNQGPGTVTSAPVVNTCAADTKCTWTFTSGTPVVLTATKTGSNYFNGWFGGCSGTDTCTLSGDADKYVVSYFSATPQAHPNFNDPNLHGPAVAARVLKCELCHGTQLTGQGLAVACTSCHDATVINSVLATIAGTSKTASTGLVATVQSISVTAPITVTFKLADGAGNPVDLTGVASKNLPISNCGYGHSTPAVGCTNTTIGFSLGYFSVGANSYNASGIASPYTIYTLSGGSPTMLSPTKMGDNTTKGVLTQTATVGTYTYAFPATVAIDQTKLANTHTFFMYATRQEDTSTPCATGAASCGANADNAKTFTAVNVISNFDAATGNAVAAKREIVTAAGCNKCHDGFQPKGAVSAAFHSGNKVDGRICNVCHNPARASSPWANSNQFVHRVHAFAEEGMPAYACVDTAPAATGTQPTPGQWTPLAADGTYAGGGKAAVIPASATDTTVCNATTFPAPKVPVVKAIAFDSTGLDLTYPQDIRNCDQCHGGAAQGAQAFTNASPNACNSCHANNLAYWFGSQAAIDGEMGGSAAFFVPGCVAGNEADCNLKAHPKLAVSPPDPQGCLLQNGVQPTGCNSNTNAAFVANAGQVPVGADTWAYNVTNVTLDANGKPQITFRMLKNGTPVAFDACPQAGQADTGGIGEIFAGYYGAPSVYAAYSVAQDGIAAPADFNSTASGFVKAICFEGKTASKGTSAATIVGPDANNYYTVTLTYTANLSGKIAMLTGGVGYSYNPSSTPPLTQTNVSSFPVTVYNVQSGTVYGTACTVAAPCATKTGGLVVPIKNVWKVAAGYTGRRVIVDNARCDNCHARMGARPTFHAGQRNDAPTCSFCHTVNQGSGGWSANASTFVHGIHGTEKRTVKLAWEGGCNIGSTFVVAGATPAVPAGAAAVPAAGGAFAATGACIDNVTGLEVAPRFYYPEVTYPGNLSCSECHTDGFMALTEAAAPNLLWTTYAKGTYANGMNLAVSYVNTTTNYGTGFSFSAATGVTTARSVTPPAGGSLNLVGSPIAAACFSCHDDTAAKAHMVANGGHVYDAVLPASNLGSEACLDCHGTGKVFDIDLMH